jgi:hypothetical protein
LQVGESFGAMISVYVAKQKINICHHSKRLESQTNDGRGTRGRSRKFAKGMAGTL